MSTKQCMVTREEMDKVFNKPKGRMSLEELKEDIALYVRLRDWVTIAELKKRYGQQAEGNSEIRLHKYPSVLIYANLSEPLGEALVQLLNQGRIHAHQASPWTYAADGECLKLPLVKKPPRGGYKRPHWLPLCFRDGPSCGLKDCPGGNYETRT